MLQRLLFAVFDSISLTSCEFRGDVLVLFTMEDLAERDQLATRFPYAS